MAKIPTGPYGKATQVKKAPAVGKAVDKATAPGQLKKVLPVGAVVPTPTATGKAKGKANPFK